jgi:hypothetical protein
MNTQLVILGCIIALIVCLAIRVHMMHSEINWIRSKLVTIATNEDGGTGGEDENECGEIDSVGGSLPHSVPQRIDSNAAYVPVNPRDMVASVLGRRGPPPMAGVDNPTKQVKPLRDKIPKSIEMPPEWTENHSSIDDYEIRDEFDEDDDAERGGILEQISILRTSIPKIQDHPRHDEERIIEVDHPADTPPNEAISDHGSDRESDRESDDSILLEDEAPPE